MPLVFNALGVDTQTDTHTDIQIKAISRSQVHAGLQPAHTCSPLTPAARVLRV